MGEAEREGDRRSEAGSALTAESPMRDLNSQTVRLSPEPKSDTQPTEPPRCPDVFIFLIQYVTVHVHFLPLRSFRSILLFTYTGVLG